MTSNFEKRQRLARLFAHGVMSQEDAYSMLYDLQKIVGDYLLESLTVESVLEESGYRWTNSTEQIRPYAEDACRRVWAKWSSDGTIANAAQDWACNLIAEYAAEDGVILIEGERDSESV
jgi:hypothetical protein